MAATPKPARKKNKTVALMEKNTPVGFNKAHKKAIEKAVNFKPKKVKY